MKNRNGSSLKKSAAALFLSDKLALIGLFGICCLLLPALFAPFIANGKPLMMFADGKLSFPFIRTFFAPESSETFVECFFNFASVMLIVYGVLLCCRRKVVKWTIFIVCAAILLVPFILIKPKMDRTDYRKYAEQHASWVLFAPIPYGADEIVSAPCAAPDRKHYLGCDDIGRDLAARLIYGSRVSLAVGIFSTLIALVIGISVGMIAGFYGGTVDLTVMRLVEILLCFPTFLLLLILMSLLGDYQIAQSIPLVIGVIGLTGWLQLAILVRGEVLKQRVMPYIQSCIVSGISPARIMFRHLLPNISAPVLISFTFGIAGAILGESGLSFLGFGVQPPAASWGNLLRQAFDDPFAHWHLTFFPGAALFLAVISFNFTGEALRKAFNADRGDR